MSDLELFSQSCDKLLLLWQFSYADLLLKDHPVAANLFCALAAAPRVAMVVRWLRYLRLVGVSPDMYWMSLHWTLAVSLYRYLNQGDDIRRK